MALRPDVELSIPSFGRLSDMMSCGYLARTFGPFETKRYLCHILLRFVEDEDDLVINHELLRPDYSYVGLPGSFSIPHSLYSHVQCNSVAGDGTFRIILDYNIQHITLRVVPQKLFAPYAGLPRGQAELQNASLIPPIFFIRLDNTVGLPLEIAKSVDADGPLLRYSDWHPMAGKASIKLRLSWYGYGPWQTQIQLRNRRKEPIMLPRLVQLIASGVDRFLRQEHGPVIDPSFPQWRIGNGPYNISPVNIVLVGVVAVSSGSIMPILRLA